MTDFRVDFDVIAFGGRIKQKHVQVHENGVDVDIIVAYRGIQTIKVEGVAGEFDESVDIFFL